MKNRNKDRKEPDNTGAEAYEFKWELSGGNDLADIPDGVLKTAEALLGAGDFTIGRKLDEDKMFSLNFPCFCSAGGPDGSYADNSVQLTVAGLKAGKSAPAKRGMSISRGFRPTSVPTGACTDCPADYCPYIVASRIKYLAETGDRDAAARSRAERSALSAIYRPRLASEYDYDPVEQLGESLSLLFEETVAAAERLTDGLLLSARRKLGTDENGRRCIVLDLAFDPASLGPDGEPSPSGYGYRRYSIGLPAALAGMSDAEKILAAGAVTSFARATGTTFGELTSKLSETGELIRRTERRVKDFSRVAGLAADGKAGFLRCTVEGDHERGLYETVRSLAAVLAGVGRLSSSEVFEVSFGEIAREFTELAESGDLYDSSDYRSHHKTYAGYIYRSFEKKRMYMLTGLDRFLLDRSAGGSAQDIDPVHMDGLMRALGTVENDTYVAVVGSSRDIERFLGADPRFRFLDARNRLVYPDLTADELYERYRAGLSSDVLSRIRDEEAFKKRFTEYISLNDRLLPFDNDERADWLAACSNSERRPVFPDGGYDPKKTADRLADIVGMKTVKEKLREFESFIAFRKKASAAGIRLPDSNLHMIFTGNAGTGKTMIARIIASMLFDIGFLRENKLVEVERKDLVAEYLGQTAVKTAKKISEALGGVLFIDEAYALTGDQYGGEAVATLLKAMEDHKDDLVVIFAGYVDRMQQFIDSNPGLSSRIGYRIHFDDYSEEELLKMLDLKVKKASMTMEPAAREKCGNVISYFIRQKNFGNGRFVDRLWQETLMNHASASGELSLITADDVPGVREMATQHDSDKKALKLENLVGLAQVKEQVRRFRNRVSFEKKGREYGIDIPRGNSHMMFLGNAGTGKTTVARILVDELFAAGLIVERKLTEVTAKDLIAEYVGQTSPKTQAVIDRSMGGVLFIDEAYQLADGGGRNSYGQDAVATLIKAMEDCKDRFVVIFAGYEKEMQAFLDMNTGIASRIGYTFHFDDYNADELVAIFKMKIEGAGLKLSGRAAANRVKAVMQYFQSVPNFGNGRFAEKVANAVYEIHAERCLDLTAPSELVSVTAEDIPTVEHMIALMPDSGLLKPSELTERENERTAFHELGHALLTSLLFPDSSIERITISAEGSGALGYVSHRGLTGVSSTAAELRDCIAVLMAGIASEEVFLGSYANGGTSDLERATDIAWRMISSFGMSGSGFAVRDRRDAEADREINSILGEGFDRAKRICSEHACELRRAKEKLIADKTLSSEEFLALISGEPAPAGGEEVRPERAEAMAMKKQKKAYIKKEI